MNNDELFLQNAADTSVTRIDFNYELINKYITKFNFKYIINANYTNDELFTFFSSITEEAIRSCMWSSLDDLVDMDMDVTYRLRYYSVYRFIVNSSWTFNYTRFNIDKYIRYIISKYKKIDINAVLLLFSVNTQTQSYIKYKTFKLLCNSIDKSIPIKNKLKIYVQSRVLFNFPQFFISNNIHIDKIIVEFTSNDNTGISYSKLVILDRLYKNKVLDDTTNLDLLFKITNSRILKHFIDMILSKYTIQINTSVCLDNAKLSDYDIDNLISALEHSHNVIEVSINNHEQSMSIIHKLAYCKNINRLFIRNSIECYIAFNDINNNNIYPITNTPENKSYLYNIANTNNIDTFINNNKQLFDNVIDERKEIVNYSIIEILNNNYVSSNTLDYIMSFNDNALLYFILKTQIINNDFIIKYKKQLLCNDRLLIALVQFQPHITYRFLEKIIVDDTQKKYVCDYKRKQIYKRNIRR